MKKVLAFVAVIALTASISFANETLMVWTDLVTATQTYNIHTGKPNGYAYGTTPVTTSSSMPLGLYGVEIWAEVLGGTEGGGIQSMSVTLYTPDTTGCFNPVAIPGSGNVSQGVPPVVYDDADVNLDAKNYSFTVPAAQYWSNPLNPTTDIDAIQMSMGINARSLDLTSGGDYALGYAELVDTELWNLTSLPPGGVTLGVFVGPSSAYFTGNQTDQNTPFETVIASPEVIPEPITMTMLGLSIVGLGGYIRRRVKVVA
jgi:hypothetical protein